MMGRRSSARGSSTPLIIAFAAIILALLAVVIDASAAYLARQRLNELADGAALYGADLGAQGWDVYSEGLTERDLRISAREAEQAVIDYLRTSGAHLDHPGLAATVQVSGDRVTVELNAPVKLPLRIPGGPGTSVVRSVGSAVITPDN